jgi:hypothetical protein
VSAARVPPANQSSPTASTVLARAAKPSCFGRRAARPNASQELQLIKNHITHFVNTISGPDGFVKLKIF